jgi:hypothetical protein
MSIQLTGDAGEFSDPVEIGEDQLSFKARGNWGTGGEVVLQETEDATNDPANLPNWSTVPASELDCDGGYNLKTGIKNMRVYISQGTGLDIFFDLKRLRTDGSITK